MIRFFLCICFLICQTASAQTWLHVGGLSWHDQPGFNNSNPGIGLERLVTNKWSVALGTYQNSDYQTSLYATGKYHWWYQNGLAINLNLGVATGYTAYPLVPMLVPEFCWHWVCGMVMPAVNPNGASALAAYLRLPF